MQHERIVKEMQLSALSGAPGNFNFMQGGRFEVVYRLGNRFNPEDGKRENFAHGRAVAVRRSPSRAPTLVVKEA